MKEINLSQLRLEARVKVMDKFGKCILLHLAYAVPSVLLVLVSAFIELRYPTEQMPLQNVICFVALMLVQVLVLVPVVAGQYVCANHLHKNGDFALSELFTFFESGKKLWFVQKYMFLAGLRTVLWIAPVVIIVSIVVGLLGMAGADLMVLLFLYYILILASVFATTWIQMRYTAGIIFAFEQMEDEGDQSPLKVRVFMKKGVEIMKGRTKETLMFNLSFIGWHLLVVITCGLAGFFVAPYFTTATMAYYNTLKNPPEETFVPFQIED